MSTITAEALLHHKHKMFLSNWHPASLKGKMLLVWAGAAGPGGIIDAAWEVRLRGLAQQQLISRTLLVSIDAVGTSSRQPDDGSLDHMEPTSNIG